MDDLELNKDVIAWTSNEAVAKLDRAVSAMTAIVENKQEAEYINPDTPDSSPEWSEVDRIRRELRYLPDSIDRTMSEAELKSALRAQVMVELACQSLRRMRKHVAWSESTVNGDILKNRDRLRELVLENDGKSDVFATLIRDKFLPFYRIYMINAIRRNAPRIPGGSEGTNLDIDIPQTS